MTTINFNAKGKEVKRPNRYRITKETGPDKYGIQMVGWVVEQREGGKWTELGRCTLEDTGRQAIASIARDQRPK